MDNMPEMEGTNSLKVYECSRKPFTLTFGVHGIKDQGFVIFPLVVSIGLMDAFLFLRAGELK